MKKTLLAIQLMAASFLLLNDAHAQLNPVDLDIPMSDGEFLAADLYQPTGCDACPVILIQTPYGKILYELFGLPLGIGEDIDASNYAIVIVDWRGRFESADAAYAGAPSIGQDGFDVVEWIATQPWCDGKIGTWGPSALGNVQYQTARNHPPSLTCICPLVAGPQTNFEEYFPGGVYRTEYVDQLDALGFGLSTFIIANPVENIVWSLSESTTFYPEEIHVPCLMIGGWYDHNTDKMIEFFDAIRTQSPDDVKDEHRLLMGPWVHGGNGSASVGTITQGELEYPNAGGVTVEFALDFFDYYLRDIDNGWDETPYVSYYQMGDNVWMESDVWPPAMNEVDLYFFQDESLRNETPPANDSAMGFDYDPQDPSPTIGGPTLRADLEQGPYDQVPLVESRNDILSFTTDVLTADVVMRGKAIVNLTVQSTATDTDFAIRLCDVYPDGRSMLVNDGIMRMRFRDGFTAADTSSMEPFGIYEIEFTLPHTAITFKQDHRIRVDVTGSNYPRFNRNMNNSSEMYPDMNGDTLVNPVIASNTIFTNAFESSRIVLPVVDFPDAVAEIISVDKLIIAPNPVHENLVFSSPLSGECVVMIADDSGKNVIEKIMMCTMGEKISIACNSFSAGHYTLTMVNGKSLVKGEFVAE